MAKTFPGEGGGGAVSHSYCVSLVNEMAEIILNALPSENPTRGRYNTYPRTLYTQPWGKKHVFTTVARW